MTSAHFIVGDVFDVMRGMPDGSVDLIVTSPPFLALRSYLPADHPDKHKEIGSEATPAEFLDTLLALTAEWRRLLAPHGSICVELGDTYSGSGGSGGDYTDTGLRAGQNKFSGSALQSRRNAQRNRTLTDWPLEKSMCGIPHLYHLSLAYARNLLTGDASPAGAWRIRNVVAWCRPNPPVGALGDKFRPATSYMTIATLAKDRYFDLDAVRQPPSPNTHARTARVGEERRPNRTPKANMGGNNNRDTLDVSNEVHPDGAPPLDWWEIPTAPYSGSHYAVYPPALITKPIQAMCPPRVCTTCGEPSRRITERTDEVGRPVNSKGGTREERNGRATVLQSTGVKVDYAPVVTVGWTDCGHDTWRNGVVLDPFAGSGTTLQVATGHGRDAIGIDLDERNVDLARERCGMFLNAVHHQPVVTTEAI